MKQFKSFFDRVSTGDIIGGSMHYSFLSSAVFFRVVEKKGKATLICDKLPSIVEYKEYDTKVISCDENRIEESGVKIRCSKYSARYDGYTLRILECDQRYYEGSATD
jgi:hypothetical protein